MCGIAGFFDPDHRVDPALYDGIAGAMADRLAHRGPDDRGTWSDGEAGIALGFRRLSILDLSPAGAQPMASADGALVMVFNGEIYNHRELRRALDPHPWRGHCDSEVLIEAFSRWGVEATLKRANGMFAVAVWDRRARRLFLARDRLGEKPLHYGWIGGVLLVASELKACAPYPAWTGELDGGAIALFLGHGFVPAPWTVYAGMRKLAPGTFLDVSAGEREGVCRAYWSAPECAAASAAAPFQGTIADAADTLQGLVDDAVAMRMEADVPLGAFLSGGIDSSLVVAIMQANSARPVKTFTIGFNNAEFNEAESAKAVAKHLGTEHTELYVTPEEAMGVIPRLPSLYDEPFADSSQIPTFLVSQLARRKVTVSLSGDAGDELFGGYSTYLWGRSVHQRISWMPRALRMAAAKSLSPLAKIDWNGLLEKNEAVVPGSLKKKDVTRALEKLTSVLNAEERETLYRVLLSYWMDPTSVVMNSKEKATALTDKSGWAKLTDFVHVMMYLDTVMYLPDDILVKVDRAAMGVSLESRVPLLDHRLIEFAWRLPLNMKIQGNIGKGPLRRLLYKYVPKQLVDRPKRGFAVPVHEWLRGPMRPWAENLLAESRLRDEGYFNPAPIRQKWQEHVTGRHNWQPQLWGVLMFQAWLEQHKALISTKVEMDAAVEAPLLGSSRQGASARTL